jgi:hypothetical protein
MVAASRSANSDATFRLALRVNNPDNDDPSLLDPVA